MRPSSKVGPAMAGPTGPVPPGLNKHENILFAVEKTPTSA